MKIIIRSLVPLACIAAFAACDRDRTDHDRAGGPTTVTGANVGSVTSDSAVDRIVASRCGRETACNNVGVDKPFASADVCRQRIRSEMTSALNRSECPRGVDAKELNECVRSIEKESCANPIDTIGRLAACRTSDLCLKSDLPNR